MSRVTLKARALVENELSTYFGKIGREVLRKVVIFVRVPARLASKNGDVVFGVASRRVGGKVEARGVCREGPVHLEWRGPVPGSR